MVRSRLLRHSPLIVPASPSPPPSHIVSMEWTVLLGKQDGRGKKGRCGRTADDLAVHRC